VFPPGGGLLWQADPPATLPGGPQIKHYYHRLLKKINTALAPLVPAVNARDSDDVRLALLSW
jgi:hypothetical protein